MIPEVERTERFNEIREFGSGGEVREERDRSFRAASFAEELAALDGEELEFRLNTAGGGESSHFATGADEAVAGYNEGPRVLSESGADGATGTGRLADGAGEVAVGRSLAGLDSEGGAVDLVLEMTDGLPREGNVVKVFAAFAEVFLHADDQRLQPGGGLDRIGCGGEESESGDGISCPENRTSADGGGEGMGGHAAYGDR